MPHHLAVECLPHTPQSAYIIPHTPFDQARWFLYLRRFRGGLIVGCIPGGKTTPPLL